MGFGLVGFEPVVIPLNTQLVTPYLYPSLSLSLSLPISLSLSLPISLSLWFSFSDSLSLMLLLWFSDSFYLTLSCSLFFFLSFSLSLFHSFSITLSHSSFDFLIFFTLIVSLFLGTALFHCLFSRPFPFMCFFLRFNSKITLFSFISNIIHLCN